MVGCDHFKWFHHEERVRLLWWIADMLMKSLGWLWLRVNNGGYAGYDSSNFAWSTWKHDLTTGDHHKPSQACQDGQSALETIRSIRTFVHLQRRAQGQRADVGTEVAEDRWQGEWPKGTAVWRTLTICIVYEPYSRYNADIMVEMLLLLSFGAMAGDTRRTLKH